MPDNRLNSSPTRRSPTIHKTLNIYSHNTQGGHKHHKSRSVLTYHFCSVWRPCDMHRGQYHKRRIDPSCNVSQNKSHLDKITKLISAASSRSFAQTNKTANTAQMATSLAAAGTPAPRNHTTQMAALAALAAGGSRAARNQHTAHAGGSTSKKLVKWFALRSKVEGRVDRKWALQEDVLSTEDG